MNAKIRLDGSAPSLEGPEPIAVIGLSCRFPGASSVSALWDVLLAGQSTITEVPPERFRLEDWYHPEASTRGRFSSRFGGFLNDVDLFDPYFFGISPREAEHMDPQQRLVLQLTWEALEDAQLRPHTLRGSRTGVFLGAAWNDYLQLLFADPKDLGLYSATGVDVGVPAGRISYAFGFRGPSFVVSTGCSSSLVAVHQACESLARGESSLAVAGGVHLMLSPETMVSLSKFGGICPDGACKAFDARANGFAPSDGAGIAVLKRLTDAERDGDPIYCTILGTAVNNDGPARAMTAPTQEGQTMVLRDAYMRAGVDPARVHYVEAHGTGTAAGDPVEARALGAVLSANRPADRPLHIGSIKTNIGHTQTAAGMAGLIKTALALKSRYLPKNLHFETPNPAIPFEELKLAVQAEAEAWPHPEELGLAGVSSFGWGATNAHAVLREYRAPDASAAPAPRATAGARAGSLVLPLSARSERSLMRTAASHRELLARPQGPDLRDLAYTSGARRTHHEHRLGVIGSSAAQVAEALAAFERGQPHPAVVTGRAAAPAGAERPRVVFVFPGQGSQWCGMGRELLATEPVFAEVLRACDAAIGKHASWSLLEQLGRDALWLEDQRLDVVQPALFAIEVALAALWRSWGVEPDVVVGHSMGEVAAAYTAGALSLDDAARVICGRSQLALPLTGQGIMASIELPQDEVERELRGLEDRVSVAVSNSPRSTVISGETSAVEAVLTRLAAREVFCRKVKVDFASHSPQVEELRRPLLDRLAALRPRDGSVPMYSTVTCAPIDGAGLDAEYWFRNLRAPVQFGRVIAEMVGSGHTLFVEISPHPILVPAMESSLGDSGALAVGSLRREQAERETLMVGLARMFVHGLEPRWDAIAPGARAVPLPAYAWDDERYWIDRRRGTGGGGRRSAGGHPLLGAAVNSSRQAGTTLWEASLSVEDLPYLRDHQVESATVFPATGFIELGLAGLRDRQLAGPLELEAIELRDALALPPTGAVLVQLVAVEHGRGAFSLSIASSSGDSAIWSTHATARGRALAAEVVQPVLELGALRARLIESLDAVAFYAAMTASDLHYGPAFQAVQLAQRGVREALVRIVVPQVTGSIATPYVVHPVPLDAAMQAVIALLGGSDGPVVPVAIDRLRVFGALSGPGWGHATLRDACDAVASDAMIADVELADDDGKVLVELRGLRLQRLARTAAPERPLPLLVQRWQLAKRAAPAPDAPVGRWLVLADPSGLGAAVARELRRRGGDAVELSDVVADPDAFLSVLRSGFPSDRPCRGIVHAWGLSSEADRRSVDALERAGQRATLSAVALVQALSRASWAELPRLWFVTQGAQWVEAADTVAAPEQAMLWGVARTLRYEHVELRASVVDLASGDWSGSRVDDRVDERVEDLVDELCADLSDDELALRPDRRYLARLGTAADGEWPEVVAPAGARPYHAHVDRPGVLDALTWREAARRAPAAGEVEIEIEASALNFRDVLIALGAIEQGSLRDVGFEHAGRVTRLGDGVRGLEVGQAVIALSAVGTMGTHATVSAALVFPRPSTLSAEAAAGIALAPGTAYYALAHVARLARGERVLIHAAAGGVGLAAIQWAQHVGAEVFATAGSEAKRDFLRSLGVRHVSDSRSLQFFDDVKRWTDGQGVDVVLNSLSGELLTRSLELLREEGRFIELGKRDYEADATVGLRPFLRSLTMSLVEVRRLMNNRPQRWREVMLELLGHVEAGVIRPLPTRVFPPSQVRDAFAHVAQGKHIGKVVIAAVDRALPIHPRRPEVRIRRDATYLVTGGLGGLGLSVARWLAEQGAGRLVLLGRRGADTETQRQAVAELRALGTQVLAAAADVADPIALAAVMRQVDAEGPALGGVIHAAGVLDDALIVNQDAAKLGRVMGPKVRGAWNLHHLTLERSLDFFVMYSSAASLLGSPGQANYAAANAFMDALAHHRQALGLPGLAINWGPFAEVGLAAAQDNRGNRMGERGMASFSPARGLELLQHALALPTAQLGAVEIDWRRWTASYPQMASSARLSQVVVAEEGGGGSSLADSVRRAAAGARQAMLEAFVREQVIAVLRLDPSRATVDVPFKAFGIDSLTGLELRNRLERGLALSALPATIIWTYPTIGALATHLVGLVNAAGAAAAAPVEAISPRPADARLELLPVQRRLWELAATPGGNLAYSALFGFELEGALDRDALTWCVGELTRRQAALRFRIDDRSDGAVGSVPPWQPPMLHEVELPDRSALEVWLRREGERAFDLRRESPFQLYLLQVGAGRQVLCVRLHFLATGGSLSLLLKELVELYNARLAGRAPEQPPLVVEFADYMVWYQRKLAAGAFEAQLAHWTSVLQGAARRDPLPLDRPRPPAPTHAGKSLLHVYSPAVAAALRQFTEAEDVTKFAALLAGLCLVLRREGGTDDVIVGTPITTRSRPELEHVVGNFINTLALRLRPAGTDSFAALAQQAKKVTLDAFVHVDAPFEHVEQRLRDAGSGPAPGLPLVQVTLAMMASQEEAANAGFTGVKQVGVVRHVAAAKFDLSILLADNPAGLIAEFEYATELFDEATIRKLMTRYGQVLERALTHPHVAIDDLEL